MKFENPKMNNHRGPIINKVGLKLLEDIRHEASSLGLALPENIKCRDNINIHGDIVYFVEANELIKIGYTSRLLDRLYNLKYTCPCELRLIAVIPAIADGLLLEKYLHDGFAEHRVRGEWFRKSDSLIALVDIFKELSHRPPMSAVIHPQPKPQHQNLDRKPKQETGPDILTIEDTAAFLQMSVEAIRRMLKAGEIPARKVRNKWRFSRRQLGEWAEKNNGKGGAQRQGG